MARLIELNDFRSQCERQLARRLESRIRFGFFRNANPVRDEGINRSFASMDEYRRFCERRYPAYYGYSRPRAAARVR
ncbi:MAG: hypothetical protein A3D95_03090 [Betaproteobacteria bacterium RIFCSPHIGHO2_12_FULL_69_13]|nr:MAG: hypothetical protein A3D95_03090 [Betaproteobacteria bacterium RIFCSPHIGHO2_12_FULL_69_13]OGA64434.1 MAG: hypothetical protein A3G83_17245 [Betaproteobacteria bacterium RIFCSPLOWO2_12_FULL_68_20]